MSAPSGSLYQCPQCGFHGWEFYFGWTAHDWAQCEHCDAITEDLENWALDDEDAAELLYSIRQFRRLRAGAFQRSELL